jgi:hypothetical protein
MADPPASGVISPSPDAPCYSRPMAERRPELEVVPGPMWPAWFEQWVLPYLREPVLWPVLLAVMGHVVLVVTALELAVWRVRSIESGVVLLALALGSAGATLFEVRRSGRPGPVTVTLALSWAASVGGAWLAERTGVL